MSSLKKKDGKTVVKTIESLQLSFLTKKRSPALLVMSGPLIGRSFAIEKDEFFIGRSEQCDFSIEDEMVSRQHCKIIKLTQGMEIIDLGSTNGTLLNGKGVTRAPLKEDDQIQVGMMTILKYHLQEEAERKFLNELYQAATKDFLTNVYNKKYFLDRLQTEFIYTKRHAGHLSVLVIDIDHFKKINDTHGHLVGDLALQKLAHHLLTHIRKDDLIARFGGEEFVVLMRDCPIEQAERWAENMRQSISQLTISTRNTTFHLTVSIGVATLSQENHSKLIRFETLLENADTNLYKAKETGRNKVCV